jgi:hypothetical protein
VINASNSTSKNNPSRWLAAPPGPTPSSGLSESGDAVRKLSPDSTGTGALRTLTTAGQILLSWLAALPGRLVDWLFAMNDTEAYWRDWQIIKTRGGLGRRYRDPRFNLLATCRPCLGTGRITREEA